MNAAPIPERQEPPRAGSEQRLSDPCRLADSPITPGRKRKLARLAEQPGSEIDVSDLPPVDESFWRNAVRNPFYRPVKRQLTVRLDTDVVAWLRRQRKSYQTRLNEVLRKAMLDDLRQSA